MYSVSFIKILCVLGIAFFIFSIVDACKPANEWFAQVYVNGKSVGTCEVVINGSGGYKGEVLRDTVYKNGVVRYEDIILVSPIR
jgi:glutaredoxin-related protein